MKSLNFIYAVIICFHVCAKDDLNAESTDKRTVIFKGKLITLRESSNGDLTGTMKRKRIRATLNKKNRIKRSRYLGTFKALKSDNQPDKRRLETYYVFKEPRSRT